MSIKIKNYTQNVDENSNVVGFVSFYIPEWQLHLNSCRYIRNKNGGFFVGFPCKEKDEKYFPFFYFDKEASKKFQDAARKAINEYLEKINVEQNNKDTEKVKENTEYDLFKETF